MYISAKFYHSIEVKCKVVKVNEVSTVKKSGDGKELRKQDVVCRYGVTKYLSFSNSLFPTSMTTLSRVSPSDL